VTDEDALLRAVIADPDDDAPRLIYADWLDEHGRGERAEFIRVQCAIAGLSPHDERRPPLRRAERRLFRRFAERWAESLRPVVWCHGYSRGFIEYVSCYAEPFLSGGEALFALAPIRQLHLINAHQYVEQLSECAFLSRPLGLSLGSWIDNRGVRVLARSPLLGRLTSLDLSRNRISTLGAHYLARSPYLGSLDDLYLRGNPIPHEGRVELRHRFGSRVHF
jgi:uncharacterized protein (TIGR02996 family)